MDLLLVIYVELEVWFFFSSNEHYVSFKVGLGSGTNNFVEICALKLLLSLAREKHIVKFQIFGDS